MADRNEPGRNRAGGEEPTDQQSVPAVTGKSGKAEEESSSRTTATSTATMSEPDPASALATATQSVAAVAEAAADANGQLGPLSLGETAADSNVTDELSGGGVAFGSFVKSVGLAVAEAQSQLDATLKDTAKALSDTTIDVIAVFEQKIKDDDGTMEQGEVQIQKLPLINYLMPTAYNWSRIYLEADMNVQEFNSRSGFNIQQKSFQADARISGSYGPFGFGVKGSAGVSYGNNSTGVDTSLSTDNAAGKIHMEATLEPRGDVELPKPFVLQKGPRLQLQVGSRTALHEGNDANKPVIGQKVEITAVLTKTDGSPMEADKPLSINISESSLNYEASGKTDGDGKMLLSITRSGAAYDPTNPVQAAVRVSFGLVSQSVGIVL